MLISKCGLDSGLITGFINSKTNIKKLQFGEDKCNKMHVGRKQILCPNLFIDNWKVESSDSFTTGIAGMVDVHAGTSKIESSDSEKYLGDVISKDGKNTKKNHQNVLV